MSELSSSISLRDLYTELLSETESSIIKDAESIIERGIPMADLRAQSHQYAIQNLQYQKKLSHLKSQLRVEANRRWMTRCSIIAEEIEELKNEGYRAQGERSELIYRDNRAVNAQDIYTQINELANYLESLEWQLKSAFKIVEKSYG